ncbi:uncharacterized protein A1O9_10575 [Exophiala aquamarina CBS 119918]|uniref:Small ribosomal subunit protein bS6m n=1 Tax=Exophiala aquamarina CBS 119918 TaxID=1182545 RepID=A0A072PDE2_9EURO|nr:uncharacterized protein A1O9_10575 [Exophiala aquamarina CBS 119918]KEF53600.1 hypothetical protein A1O9_10575 [Exophiala aquamarina CBS 119918]
MLYELIVIARPGNVANIKEIARIAGTQILSNKGVIRGLKNWGQFDLPRPTTKHQAQHRQGHYFIMQFDSSVRVQDEVKRTLSLDPRLIRYSVVKIGDKLGGVNGAMEDVTGTIPWNGKGESANAYENIFPNQRVVSPHAPLSPSTYTPQFTPAHTDAPLDTRN